MATYLELAKSLIEQLEACRLTAYLDTAGKPTIGWGHTGPEVQLGQTVSQAIADHDLDVDVAIADAELRKVCRFSALEAIHAHQRAALVSFVYNVGANPDWTIWKDVNDGNLADVPVQLLRFTHEHKDGKLVEVPGLEHRREAERVYWNTGDVDAAVAVTTTPNAVPAPPSSYTRAADTPPVPAANPPMVHTSLAVKIGTAVCGLGTIATQLHGVVAPHADESPIFQHVAVALSGVIILASCIGILIHVNQHQARVV